MCGFLPEGAASQLAPSGLPMNQYQGSGDLESPYVDFHCLS